MRDSCTELDVRADVYNKIDSISLEEGPLLRTLLTDSYKDGD